MKLIPATAFLLMPTAPRVNLSFINGGSFVTACDGESGTWGLGQNYWAQSPDGVWHPDEDGTVLTQLIMSLDQDNDWCVQREIQFALHKDGKLTNGQPWYPKFELAYRGCKFCPEMLALGPNERSSAGTADWTERDPDGESIAGPTIVQYQYNVVLDGSSGQLDEVYFQANQGPMKLAYWKRTLMQQGLGDVRIEDVLKGNVAEHRV